jgi:4-amino-4-deoxy-L-arabinose transferase-like glycosyltransferase
LTRAPFAGRLVLPVAVLVLVLEVAFANGYGYHRDELYFRTAARHMAVAYDDQGFFTPVLGRISEALFGETPRGLRVFSAVAAATLVVLVALLARELGAGGRGQLVAAAGTASAGFVLAAGHILSTTTFDQLVWVATLLVVARVLAGGDERLWIVAGGLVGVGLENKQLPLLLVASLVAGLALDRRLLWVVRSPWLWLGAALAVILWLPNLAWQATHGWPQLALAEDIRRDDGAENRATLLPLQVLFLGPFLAPVLGLGLWGFLRETALRPWRALGIAYVVLLVLVFATAGRPYYAAPYLLVLLAAGCVLVERWLVTRTRELLVAGLLLVSAAIAVVIVLPVLHPERLQATPIPDLDEDAIETVGWPALVRTVARVHAQLPAEQRGTAVVFAGNYGEAGAIDRFGAAYGLPRAYSGQNAYARFGIPPGSAGPVIVLGYSDPSVDFRACRHAATIDNGVGLDNEEQGGAVFVCTRPRRPWAEAWPDLTHLDA